LVDIYRQNFNNRSRSENMSCCRDRIFVFLDPASYDKSLTSPKGLDHSRNTLSAQLFGYLI
jgi:hypothetical protein